MEEIYDVVCVGGGISGLFTVKYMLSEGLSVIALEKEEEIGGVWRFKGFKACLGGVSGCST